MDNREAVKKLHAEINSDEDFDKFLEREGLLVMDVYTEWCGPCISMSSSLEKLKLELGGDNLHLAQCNSNKIKRLEKFRNSSEPTWLLASNNKVVDCLTGANMPVLLETITEELELEKKCKAGKFERNLYDWNNLPPIEEVRENRRLNKSNTSLSGKDATGLMKNPKSV